VRQVTKAALTLAATVSTVAALGAGLSALPASAATSGTFSLTGSMNAARYLSTATLLPDGDVLVAGGAAATGPSAELYDPATGTWTVTGAMITPGNPGTATLLPDGQVLVAGGTSAAGLPSSAELYNPATGTWTATGAMITPRSGGTATLLPDGQVLVAGGGSATASALSSAELYNPATGTWTATGSMTTARREQAATLLGNGQVLMAGGYNSSDIGVASAELYNPATGKFTPTGTMTSIRDNPAATLLPDGEVLVTGGGPGGASGAFAELYNPATGTWAAATGGAAVCTPIQVCRTGSTATLLANGDVLVTGGYSYAEDAGYRSTTSAALLYDPATNVWTKTGSMSTGRVGDTASLLPDGQVLVAGGQDLVRGKGTILASAELYTP
jgi:N-acetylneuraminic acid mutarotase